MIVLATEAAVITHWLAGTLNLLYDDGYSVVEVETYVYTCLEPFLPSTHTHKLPLRVYVNLCMLDFVECTVNSSPTKAD